MTGPTLVTGAAGFAGGHLLDLLAAEAADVVAWHRPNGSAPTGSPRLRWQAVNLLEREAVRAAIREIKPARVFHCAGAAHVGQAWDQTTDTLAVNVMGTQHVIDALRETHPHARVLIPSSALVYAPSTEALSENHTLCPPNPYGVSKLAQEMVGCGNLQRPRVWIARPFNHFGPRQDPSFVTAGFARQIAEIEAGHREPQIAVGNLEARRDLTDVRDTVRAYALIIERGTPERPYNVCSGRALPVGEILENLLSRARTRINVVTDPARYRPNDSPVVLGNHGRIRDELGWQPTVPLEQTLDDLLAYWRARVSDA